MSSMNAFLLNFSKNIRNYAKMTFNMQLFTSLKTIIDFEDNIANQMIIAILTKSHNVFNVFNVFYCEESALD